MKVHAILFSLIFASAALIGCGDDDNDAPAQCEALFTVLCQRLDECLGQDFNACFDINANSPPACSEADGVSASYDECFSTVRDAPCSLVDPNQLPDSCSGVILFD